MEHCPNSIDGCPVTQAPWALYISVIEAQILHNCDICISRQHEQEKDQLEGKKKVFEKSLYSTRRVPKDSY